MATQRKAIPVNESRHMVVTQTCRLSFPVLFTPRQFEDNPREQKLYSAHLIFDSIEELKKPWNGKKTKTVSVLRAIANAKEDQWGSKEKWPRFAYPVVRRGDDQIVQSSGEVRSGYEGKVFLQVKSGENFPPRVVLANGEPASERDVYGGCYVQAQLLARPYLLPQPGVSLKLLAIRKVRDGEKFGSGVDLFEYEELDSEEFDGTEDNGED